MGDFEDLMKAYGEDDFRRIAEISCPASEDVFINRLYEEIDAIIRLIESGPKERSSDTEDRLTLELVACLNSAGYLSKKDPMQGGHVDIFVEPKKSRKYQWYGEAKIWNGVAYLESGIKQLLNRYARGRDRNIGFLVYFKSDNFVTKMSDWKDHLHGLDDVNDSLTEIINQFSFSTFHDHQSGNQLKVRHFSLNIYWNPDHVV